ncbi:MAG: universal stress protein [Planctomycetes bacterium]|nr:universal stress protein [Planctomycetota bacterium]
MRTRPVYRNVLVLTDLSGRAAFALPHACALVAPEGTIHLVHVVERPKTPNPMYAHYESKVVTPEEKAERKREVEDALLALVKDCPPPAGVVVQRHVFEESANYVAERICAAVTELKADIVVMASHGRSGLARILLGSIAEGVMRQCPVPTLVVRVPDSELSKD